MRWRVIVKEVLPFVILPLFHVCMRYVNVYTTGCAQMPVALHDYALVHFGHTPLYMLNTYQAYLHLSYYTEFGSFYKLYDVAYFLSVGHLFLHLQYGIEHRGLSVEYQAVCVCDVADYLFRHVVVSQYRSVHAAILYGVLACNDKGGDILAEAAAALYHGGIAYTCAGIGNDTRREYHAAADLAVTGNLRAVSEDVGVTNLRIVGYVYALHDEVEVAYCRLSAAVSRTVYHNVFTYNVLVSDNQLRAFAAVAEVLRLRAEYRVLENLVGTPQLCAVHNAYVRVYYAVIANLNILFNICKRIYCHVLPPPYS